MMRKILFLFVVIGLFSCEKTKEKVTETNQFKTEEVLDTIQQKTIPQDEEEEVFVSSISDFSTKQLAEAFKNEGAVNFYIILENDITKDELQKKTLTNLVNLFREAKYSYGVNVSRNNMYRKMTININYNDKNDINLESYFSKIKNLLNKIHKKGVHIES